MWYFLSTDAAGGITGPVDFRSNFEKWIDSIKIDTASLLLGFFIGAFVVFLYYKLSEHIRKKQDEKIQKNEDKKE